MALKKKKAGRPAKKARPAKKKVAANAQKVGSGKPARPSWMIPPSSTTGISPFSGKKYGSR